MANAREGAKFSHILVWLELVRMHTHLIFLFVSYELSTKDTPNEDMILALHIALLSYGIPFTGKHEPNKLTSS